ncbi:hypothetical protein ABPG77_007943 [Micractinium sp. CCAP 211/92]
MIPASATRHGLELRFPRPRARPQLCSGPLVVSQLDKAAAGGAGEAPPPGSASAAVAEVVRAVQEGTAAIDEPVPGLDEVGGRGRRAGEPAMPGAAGREQAEGDSESDSDPDSDSSSSSSSDEEGDMGRRRAATRRRKGEPQAAAGGGELAGAVPGGLVQPDTQAAKRERKKREREEKAARKAEEAALKAEKAARKHEQQAAAARAEAAVLRAPLAHGEHPPSELPYPRAAAGDTAGEGAEGESLSWLLSRLLS